MTRDERPPARAVNIDDQVMVGLPAHQTRRLLERRLSFSRAKLFPPRSVRVEAGILKWDAPSDPTGVTHYNIYVDDDRKVVRRVPIGQTECGDTFTGRRFAVSSYNAFSGEESGHRSSLTAYDAGQSITIGAVTDVNILALSGAVADCVLVTDATMANGSTLLTCAGSEPFKASDVGKAIAVDATAQLGTITSYVSASQVHVSFAASAAIDPSDDATYGSQAAFGTDNAAALDTAVAFCLEQHRPFSLLSGVYFTTRPLVIHGQLSVKGNDKDNSAFAALVFGCVSTGLHIVSSPIGSEIFAVSIDKVAVITIGGADDAVLFDTPSQCVWREPAINDFWGRATNGLSIINTVICFLYDPIITKSSNAAIRLDDTGRGTSHLMVDGGNAYQNEKVFQMRGIIGHVIVRNLWVEQFGTFLDLGVTAGQQTSIENLIFDGCSFLAGTDNHYDVYTDPKIIRLTGLAGHNYFAKGLRFENCRLFATDDGHGVNVVDTPFDIDMSAENAVSAFTFDLRNFLYTGVKTALFHCPPATNGTKITVYSTRVEAVFSSAVPMFDGASRAQWNEAFWAGPGMAWEDFSDDFTKGSLQVKSDPDESTADPGQLIVGNTDFSRALRLKIPTTASGLYTAIMYLYGALSSLAIKGQVSIGNVEQPTHTLFVHNDTATSGQTHLRIKAGAGDVAGDTLFDVVDASNNVRARVFQNGRMEIWSDDATNGQFRIIDTANDRALYLSVPTADYRARVKFAGALSTLAIDGGLILQVAGAKFLTTDSDGLIGARSSVNLSADVTGSIVHTQVSDFDSAVNALITTALSTALAGYYDSATIDATFATQSQLAIVDAAHTATETGLSSAIAGKVGSHAHGGVTTGSGSTATYP